MDFSTGKNWYVWLTNFSEFPFNNGLSDEQWPEKVQGDGLNNKMGIKRSLSFSHFPANVSSRGQYG